MAATNEELENAIEYYCDHLVSWYEAEYVHHIDTYSDVDSRTIASFYGNQKLLQEYGAEMADLWCVIGMTQDTDLDNLGLSDTQWGHRKPAKTGFPDVLNFWIWDHLYEFTKKGEKNIKRFDTTRYTYRLEAAWLSGI